MGGHRISNVECLQQLIHQYVRRTTWLQQVGQPGHIHSLLQWEQFLLCREQYLPWFANVVELDALRRGFHRARIVDETKRFVVHCIQQSQYLLTCNVLDLLGNDVELAVWSSQLFPYFAPILDHRQQVLDWMDSALPILEHQSILRVRR